MSVEYIGEAAGTSYKSTHSRSSSYRIRNPSDYIRDNSVRSTLAGVVWQARYLDTRDRLSPGLPPLNRIDYRSTLVYK